MAEEKERLEKEQKYKIERLQLQLECQRLSAIETAQYSFDASQNNNQQSKLDINNFSNLLPKLNPNDEDFGAFINVFERQIKFMNLPESSWISYLISTLTSGILALIVLEPEETQEYKKR